MKATEILDQIRGVLGIELSEEKIVLETMKLDNGTVIESTSFEKNSEVFIVNEDEEKISLPKGEYTLEDGRVLSVIEDGIISEIKDVDSEEEKEEVVEEVDAEKEEEMAYATKEELAELKSAIEEIKAIIEKEDLQSVEDNSVKSEETTKKVVYSSKEEEEKEVELTAEVVEPIAHNPEAVSSNENKFNNQKVSSHLSRIREMIYNNK